MFGKFRSTRTPAATSVLPAPQFEAGPPNQSASKTSPSLVKKFLRVKHVFRRSSAAQKDAPSQGTPSRRQGVPTPSQPSQGPTAVTYNDRAEFDRRPYLHPSVEPTRSSSLLNLSSPFQAGCQSSTSAAHRSNLSATASPLLAPPQSVAARPATSFAPTRSSSNCSIKPAAPRRTASLNTSSPLAPSASVATTVWNDAGTIERQDAPRRSTPSRRQGVPTHSQPSQVPSALTHDDPAEFHRRPYLHPSVEPTQSSRLLNLSPPFHAGCQSSTSAAHRSNLSATASHLLAPPQPVAARPATSFAPTRSSSNYSTKPAAPRRTTSLNISSPLAPPASVATTVWNDAGTIERQDAPRQGTPSRRQGVPTPSRPSQVPSALHNLSPPFQVRWQSSTSSAAHRSNLSATASPLLAPPQFVAARPATSFAPTRSSSNCSTQSAAPRVTTSFNDASLLAPPASIATIPATSSALARSSFQSSAPSTTSRSTYSPKISSPLAPPRCVAATPATTFSSAHYPARHSASSTAPHSTSSLNVSPLLAPPQSVANTPATEPSSVFSSFDRSKPSDNNSSTHQLIAELEETVAHLHRQYNDARRSVHTMIQWHVFPYAKSLADEAKKAREELDKVLKQIAAVDTDCSELEALLRDEHKKLEETEEALKKAYWHREGVEEEHALLQADNHELQAGQPVDGVWQQRSSEPLQQDSTPSQSVANQKRGSSLATLESSQRVKSWDSQWETMIERQRYSLPRPVQVTTSESNEPERRTSNMRVRDARPADTSDYFGTPLRWGQLAPVSSLYPQKESPRPGKHA